MTVIAVVLAGLRLLIGVLGAHLHRRRVRRHGAATPRYLGPASVIVPAHNQAATIAATVWSLAGNDYPGLEVIVVDDGSTDGTPDIVEAHGLPGVFVIRQAHAGRAAAVDAGIRYARHDLLVLVDGDTVVETDTIGRLLQQLSDPAVGAVAGHARITGRGDLLSRWQHLENVIGFNLDRRMLDAGRCMVTVPDAIGAFRRSAVPDLAGSTDFASAAIRAGGRVAYEPAAVAWTGAPATWRQLRRQQCGWYGGAMRAVWKHRRALLRGGAAGRLSRRGLGYLLLFRVVLPLTAPMVDLYAVHGLIFGSPAGAVAVWIGFTAIQVATAGYALRLGRERLGPLWRLTLQQIVHRQLTYLVVGQAIVLAVTRSAEAGPANPDAAILNTGYFAPMRPWTAHARRSGH